VLKQGNDTSTPFGRLQFHRFAAFDEFLRELIAESTLERLALARARGRIGGRPPAWMPVAWRWLARCTR
jgi:DNA invertase Pin-like site-specific DNA recombinase